MFTNDLTLGSRGNQVQCLQTALNDLGYPVATSGPGSKGHETTYFGKETKNAVSQFQKDNHISPAVGYFGPETRGAIEKAIHQNQYATQNVQEQSLATIAVLQQEVAALVAELKTLQAEAIARGLK
jgi:peptidoglycan hydrolase-like protein with peptidoglycan-binding domain